MRTFLIRLSAALWLAMLSPVALSCPACDEPQTVREALPTLTPKEVHARVLAEEITVIDANPRDIFEKHHVPGARRVDYDNVSVTDLPEDKTAPIVFYCMNERCGASRVAAQRAREVGWMKVYLMPAGIQGWIHSGLPIQRGA